jgi:hypothetical protein
MGLAVAARTHREVKPRLSGALSGRLQSLDLGFADDG